MQSAAVIAAVIPLIIFSIGFIIWIMVTPPKPSPSRPWVDIAKVFMWAGLFAFAFSMAGQAAGCSLGNGSQPVQMHR